MGIITLPIRITKNQSQICGLTHSPNDVNGLRGGRRFVADTEGVSEDAERNRRQQAAELYKRWWNLHGGYSHAILLWLQRAYVYGRFEKLPAQPGLDDDTPYDFDHICPQSHWNYWTGKAEGNRLIDFHAEKVQEGADKEGHFRLGHAIGNVRVWHSGDNRGDCDASPAVKLKLTSQTASAQTSAAVTNGVESLERLRDSVISCAEDGLFADETQAWKLCSPDTDDSMHWKSGRALAFQKAIEQRTFNLYKHFYADLHFADL